MSDDRALELEAEQRRKSNHLLRRATFITTCVAFLLAVSEADRVYFLTGNMWTSWGFVPVGFALLAFPVGYTVATGWILLRHLKVLRGEEQRRTRSYTNQPLPRGSVTRWPSVTIQIPIYAEPFDEVIRPTLDAARAAAARYREATGQTAELLISDDGLLVLCDNDLEGFVARASAKPPHQRTAEEAHVLARTRYYAAHGLAWVARPRPVAGVPETQRAGRFKKASNLNHTFRLAAAVAAGDAEALRPFRFSRWSGRVEIGEIILQLDKDSLTHPGVVLATVPEFVEDPKLAYTQHPAYPSNETENYFSLVIGHFTRMLYDVCFPARALFPGAHIPVMGHNLFIRKSALLEIGGWGEDSVCEDLYFMLGVHIAGYHGKYVAYPGMEFGEVVARVYEEELEKFRRYAYGAAEAVFNPIRDWERRGILKDHFRRYTLSPHVGWFHVIELLGFLFSLLNLATIIPASLAVAFGSLQPLRALIMVCFSLAIFQWLASFMLWRVRRKGAAARMNRGEAWRGWAGAGRMALCQLGLGAAFMGYGVSVLRGGLAYLRGSRLSFAATSVDDLERISLLDLLRRMRSSHLEALAVVGIASAVLWAGTAPVDELGYESLVWAVPCALHATLPYLMNPYLFRKIGQGSLGLIGLRPARRQALATLRLAPSLIESIAEAPAGRSAERRRS